jgi:hypothetical protein
MIRLQWLSRQAIENMHDEQIAEQAVCLARGMPMHWKP